MRTRTRLRDERADGRMGGREGRHPCHGRSHARYARFSSDFIMRSHCCVQVTGKDAKKQRPKLKDPALEKVKMVANEGQWVEHFFGE